LDGFDPAVRMKSLEQLLVEKGYIQPAALDAMIETYAQQTGAMNGARVLANGGAILSFAGGSWPTATPLVSRGRQPRRSRAR
jgi:nitrile hydratase subunit alpha